MSAFDALTGFAPEHDAARAAKIALARESLIAFAELMMPDKVEPLNPAKSRFITKTHHRAIADACEKLERGLIQYLILTAPPRHGKSQMTTIYLPAHYIGRDPYENIIVGCYNDILAKGFGRKIRAVIEHPVYQEIFPDLELAKGGKSVDHMATTADGMIACVGRGGTTTGRGAGLFIVDDPIKDRREAKSQTIRDDVWMWFKDVVETRLMSDTGIIVVMLTRWHDDDIVGRLTNPDNPHYNEDEAAKWHILNMPALAEEDDPLGRKPGEALWEERFSAEFLRHKQKTNPVGFSALYQQNPTPDDGEYFTREMFRTYSSDRALPANLRMFAASDHSVKTGQRNDPACILIGGVDETGNLWLVDCVWKKMNTLTQVQAMLEKQQQHKPVKWWAGRDQISGSIGPFLRREMSRQRTHINLTELADKADKVQKAQPAIAMMNAGQVLFPSHKPWFSRAQTEMLKFDNWPNDDFVDTLANLCRGLERILAAGRRKPEEKKFARHTFGWMKQRARLELIVDNDNKLMRTG